MIAISIITSVQVRAQSKLADSAWPAFRHDAQMTAFTPAKGPVLPEVKWKAQFGSGALGSPVLGLDGTIYVPGNVDSALYAITPDGKSKWIFVGKVKEGELFVAPPIIGQDGKIYLGSTQNIFYAINPTGTEHWRLKLGGAINFSANIGNDGTIYVAAQDCNLYAITPAGKIKWQVNMGQLPANGPAIAEDGTIYVVVGEFLKGFKPDGTLQLEFDNPDMGFLNGLMVEGKKLFYITSLAKPLIKAINNSPRILWEHELDPSFKGALLPALGKDGRIYFATEEEGGVVALDHNGNKRWIFTVPGALNMTELVVDDSNHVYLVNDKLGLTSVSADGKLRWSLPEVRCAFSPAIGADGTIYVASDKKLYAIGPQLPLAVNLSKVFGDAQRGCSRSILANPIQVLIKDQYGAPFPNHPVQFRVLSGGGSVSNAQVLTDNNGMAQVFWTLGPLAGEQRLEASSQIGSSPLAGSPQVFAAIAQTPQISGAPVLVFNPTAVKLTSKKVYTIQNNSDCNLAINNLEILHDAEGNFALALNAAQLVNVQPGESLTVSVQYTPQDCNADSAMLRISSDDPQTPQFDVTLRGTILSEPDLDAAPNVLSFGEVLVGDSKLLSIIIRNAGAERLRVDSVVVKSPVFAVEPQEFLLECNESNEKVSVAFMPVARGHFVDTLLIWSNDPDEKPFVVELVGTGIGPAIVVEPGSLEFGAECSGRDSVQFVTVKNIGEDTLRVNALVFSDTVFSTTQTTPFPVAPGDSVKILVKYTYVAGRENNGTLSISSNDPDEGTVIVALHGKGKAPDIKVTAPPFGDVCIGTIKSSQVCISNPSDCELRVDSLDIIVITGAMNLQAPEALTMAMSGPLFVIPPHGQECFNIKGAPLREGSFRVDVIVWSNAPSSPDTISIPGTGVPPAIASMDKVDFGQVLVNTSKPDTARVWNADECDVIINSLEIKGGNTSAFSLGTFALPDTLKAGDTANIPVIFAPNLIGPYTDTLLVFNNDPKRNPLKIALAGVGDSLCTAIISVNPTALSFGEVRVDNIVSQNLTISNQGCDTLRVTDMRNSLPVFYINPTDKKFNLAPGGKRVVPVFFAPAAEVFYLDTLRIVNNDTRNGTVLVPLNGHGIGADSKPDIVVKPGSLDFGTVCGPVDSIVVVSNKGKASLQVDSLQFSNTAFFTDHADSFVVPPGSSEKITVRFTPGRDTTGTLSIFSNDTTKNPIVVNLHGKGGVPDIAAATTVVFDTVEVQTCAGNANSDTTTLVIHNQGNCNLVVDSLDVISVVFSLVTPSARYVIPPGGSLQVKLKFTPTAPGDASAVLRIFSDDPDERPFLVTLRGHGLAAPDIDVTPLALDFGSVPVGNKMPKSLQAKNVGAMTLVVDSLVISSPVFTTEAQEFALECNEDSLVTVVFTPTDTGAFAATLRIYSNDPNENPLVVTLRGNGIAPVIAVNPGSLDFGVVCGPVDSIIVVSNEGKADLQVDSLRFSNTAFSTTHADSFVVAPDGREEITVHFTPVAGRDTSGTLSIFSNDKAKNPLVVNLHGTGGVPDIAGALEVKFDTVSVACGSPADSARQTYVIRNLGSCDLLIDTLTVTGDFSIISGGGKQAIKPGESKSVVLQFTPNTAKVHADTLKIVSNDPDELPFKVVLSGVGVAVPTIAVEPPDTLDFGDVPVGNNKELTIKITSRGALTLRVDSLVSSCRPVFTTEADEFTLVCGEDSSVTVAFSPGAPGAIVCTLSIYTNDPKNNPTVVTLRGNGVTGILAACENIDFGKTCADNPVTKACTFTNTSKIADLEISSLRLASGRDFHFGSVSLPARLKPDSSITISIIFAPEKTGDKRDVQDTVFISIKFSEQEHRMALLGHKRSEDPDIVLDTSFLEFQNPVGIRTDCQAARITNEGCSPLEVSDLKLAGYTTNVFEICPGLQTPFTLMLGDLPRPVDVFFMPIDFREYKDELRIYNDDPDRNPATVALVGRVPSGGEVCLRPDSTRIRFGSVFIKAEKTVRLGVTNCSNPAALIKVEASLANGKDYAVAPDSLPNVTPGAKQYLNITFRPTKTGERSDTLRLVVTSVFNANVRTELEIILQGTGIDDEVYARPNAFTPNDDDKNDFAKIHFPGYKMLSPVLRIYDLRGIAVRVLRRINSGGDEIAWDGYQDESRGRLMPPGAYVWLLEDQGKKVGSGMVVLIR